MKNYLVLNGQKIELTPEQYQEVCNAVLLETKSPFGRREKGEAYWFIGDDGLLCATGERSRCIDNLHHGIANYCSNKELMARRANYEAFERILWRFSEENGGPGNFYPRWGFKDGWDNYCITDAHSFGPSFVSEKVLRDAIKHGKKWLQSVGLTEVDIFC